MPWVNTTAKQSYASGHLRHAGGGDPDVFTQSGRQTRVELSTSNLRVDDSGDTVLADVFYSVREMRTNNTFLTWSGTARLPIPEEARRHPIVIGGARNYDQSWIVLGKHHDWMELDNADGTIVERGQYRIDGPGPDLTNAGVQLSLRVGLRYFADA